MSLPLDQWVSIVCPEIEKEIRTHIAVMVDDKEVREPLLRCIMITVRQGLQDRGIGTGRREP